LSCRSREKGAVQENDAHYGKNKIVFNGQEVELLRPLGRKGEDWATHPQRSEKSGNKKTPRRWAFKMEIKGRNQRGIRQSAPRRVQNKKGLLLNGAGGTKKKSDFKPHNYRGGQGPRVKATSIFSGGRGNHGRKVDRAPSVPYQRGQDQ